MKTTLSVSLILLVALVFFSGCTTVPINVNIPNNDHNISNNGTKSASYSAALLVQNHFSSFTLKSKTSNPNIDYLFEYHIGNDISETLSLILGNRFSRFVTVSSADEAQGFEYIIIPSIDSSRLKTYISDDFSRAPGYALEINLGVEIIKNGNTYKSFVIRKMAQNDTKVACWTCWGEDVLDQDKIRNEYKILIKNVMAEFEDYLKEYIK